MLAMVHVNNFPDTVSSGALTVIPLQQCKEFKAVFLTPNPAFLCEERLCGEAITQFCRESEFPAPPRAPGASHRPLFPAPSSEAFRRCQKRACTTTHPLQFPLHI